MYEIKNFNFIIEDILKKTQILFLLINILLFF